MIKTKCSTLHLISVILILLSIAIILPVFIISYYNYPFLDDFLICNQMKMFNFIDFIIFWFTKTGGRYFYYFLLALSSLSGNQIFLLVKLVPPIVILLLVYAIYRLIKLLFPHSTVLSITAIFLFAFIINLSSVFSTIFWLSSIITNIFAAIVFILYVVLILHTKITELNFKNGIISFVFLFIIIGLSETFSLVLILLMMYLWVVIFLKKEKRFKLLLFITIITILFSFFSFLAPGNFNRLSAQIIPEPFLMRFLGALVKSVLFTFKNFMNWFQNIFFILISLIYTVFIIRYHSVLSMKSVLKIHPFLSLLLFLIVPACYVIAFFARGFVEHRMTDFSYFLFLLIWFYNLIVIIVHYKRFENIKPRFQKKIETIAMVLMIAIIIILVIKPNHIRTFYGDIYKGRLTEFKQQQEFRHEQMKLCPPQNCLVDSFKTTNFPYTIFTRDYLTPSPHHPVNLIYGKYFGIDSVFIPYPSLEN